MNLSPNTYFVKLKTHLISSLMYSFKTASYRDIMRCNELSIPNQNCIQEMQ